MTMRDGDNLPQKHRTGERGIPEHVVDAFFDRELSHSDRERFMKALGRDRTTAGDVVRTQRALNALRQPVNTPDLSRAILNDVARKTPLLTRRSVRHVRWTRVAAMAALVAIVGGAFVTQRLNPAITSIGETPAQPIGTLATALPLDTEQAMNTLRQTADGVRSSTIDRALIITVRAEASRAPRPMNVASILPRMEQNPVPDDLVYAQPRGWTPHAINWSSGESLGCGTAVGCGPSSTGNGPLSATLLFVDAVPPAGELGRQVLGVK